MSKRSCSDQMESTAEKVAKKEAPKDGKTDLEKVLEKDDKMTRPDTEDEEEVEEKDMKDEVEKKSDEVAKKKMQQDEGLAGDVSSDEELIFEEDLEEYQKVGAKKSLDTVWQKAPKKARKQQDPLYLVESIMGHEKRNGEWVFLVRWLNYDSTDNSWEPLDNFRTCRQFIYNYLDKNGTQSIIDEVAEYYTST